MKVLLIVAGVLIVGMALLILMSCMMVAGRADRQMEEWAAQEAKKRQNPAHTEAESEEIITEV